MTRSKDTAKQSLTSPFSGLPPGSLRVLQLSDAHLYASENGRLMGINTRDSFHQVLEQARTTLGPIDLVLATGDLVHDASPEGYTELQQLLSALGVPVYCLPGNHDVTKIMARHLAGGLVSMPFMAQHGDWLLVQLDSTLPGKVEGHLSPKDLKKLESALEAHPDKHVLISLHHHPVPVGCTWLDAMKLGNAEDLLALLDRYAGVRGIIWGHVHQSFEDQRNNIRLIGSPATCFQFMPRSPRFGLDHEPPGYRWLALLPDGEIRTGTQYLDAVPDTLDCSCNGY